jgi:tetratricopeptide (TPR) repeat protein
MVDGMRREAPLRIFVGYTSDLHEHPRERSYVDAAESAVMRAGHAISNMAYFAARDTSPADYCTAEVGRADIFVGVIGMRYGSTVRDRPDLSYTELEFEAATAAGIPRLILIVRDDAAGLPAVEQPAGHAIRQQAFRGQVQEVGVTTLWVASPAETELRLYQALVDLKERTDSVTDRAVTMQAWPVDSAIIQPADLLDTEQVRWMCELEEADLEPWARWIFDAACERSGRSDAAIAAVINRRVRGLAISAAFVEACRRGEASPPLAASLAAFAAAGPDVIASLARTLTSERSGVKLDEVKRRQFLKSVTAAAATTLPVAGLSGGLSEDILGRLTRALAGSHRVDATTMDYLDHRIAGYWHDYHVTKLPGQNLILFAMDDLSRVVALLERPLTPSSRLRLEGIAARAALAVGAFLWDTRSYSRSRDFLRNAITAARNANDTTIEAVAWGWSSFGWTYDISRDESGIQALHCARAGRQVCRTNGAVGSWLACVEAEVQANLGDQSASVDALRDAMLSSHVSTAGEYGDWSRFDDSGRAGFLGVCMLRLGRYSEARDALQESLALLNPSEGQRRLTLMIDIAQANAKDGAIDEACANARHAVRMAADLKSPVKAQRIQPLRDDLTAHRDAACVRLLEEEWTEGLGPSHDLMGELNA